jgi:hypothetical protein
MRLLDLRRLATLAALAAGAGACQRSLDAARPEVPAETAVATGARDGGSASEIGEPPAASATSAVIAEPAPSLPRTTGVSGLITFVVPDGASVHEIFAAQGGQYLKTDVYVSGPCPGDDDWSRGACVLVALERRDGPGWKTLAEATHDWNESGDGARNDLGEGVTAAGVFYAVRSFEVRTGFTSHGKSIHRMQTVSRVYANLDVGRAGHVTCTGYLEREVVTARDPVIQTLLDICTSMRRAP